MRIKDINKNGYKLHLIKTKRFKTVLIKIVFWNKLQKEDLTLRNMLVNNLLFSSARYNTIRKMAIKKEELFSAELFSRNYRRGNQIMTEINLSVIDDNYSEEKSLKNSIEFLFDIINNPNVENDKFNETAFKINYEKLKSAIKREKEDPMYWGYKRFKELIGKDNVLPTSILGTEEELEKITSESLYKYYQSFFENNHIDIFIVGDINFKEIEKLITNNFDPKAKDIPYNNICISYEKEFSEVCEQSKFSQSKLMIGASISDLTKHEKFYEGMLYNIILGNSPNSKLFQNVREKNSFAYSISSSLNRLDGLFYVCAGISSKNYQEAKTEIYKQFKQMQEGRFSEKSLKDAKEVVLSVIKEVDEYPGAILDHYFNFLYLGNETLIKQKEEIKKVTKEDIVRVANKINIDTIFLLKEGQNERISN
ncbi:MAG: EF-P 5-aminopentanol modification-associated protein YfmF [Bacilli bacterium]